MRRALASSSTRRKNKNTREYFGDSKVDPSGLMQSEHPGSEHEVFRELLATFYLCAGIQFGQVYFHVGS